VPFRSITSNALVADFRSPHANEQDRPLHTGYKGGCRVTASSKGRCVAHSIVHVLLVTGLWLCIGCIGPLQQWGEATAFHRKTTSFDPATLKQERAAVLNAVVGFGLEGYAHQVSRSLSSALEQRPAQVIALPAHESLNRINRGGLTPTYADMVSTYARTGILNRVGLQELGMALQAAYVFQPSLASFSQSMSGRFSFFGLRVLQTRVTMLRLSLQLWDARTGDIVWEASGEATLAGEDVREFRIPFDEIARRLWTHMLDDLFKDLPAQ
jgi:hypothetical protein